MYEINNYVILQVLPRTIIVQLWRLDTHTLFIVLFGHPKLGPVGHPELFRSRGDFLIFLEILRRKYPQKKQNCLSFFLAMFFSLTKNVVRVGGESFAFDSFCDRAKRRERFCLS